jgi:hypothetical protein
MMPKHSPSTAQAQPKHSPSTAQAQPKHSPSTAQAQPTRDLQQLHDALMLLVAAEHQAQADLQALLHHRVVWMLLSGARNRPKRTLNRRATRLSLPLQVHLSARANAHVAAHIERLHRAINSQLSRHPPRCRRTTSFLLRCPPKPHHTPLLRLALVSSLTYLVLMTLGWLPYLHPTAVR